MKLLLTVREAAEALGTNRQNVYKLIRKGELSAVKLGTTRIPVAELERWVEAKTEVDE